MARTCIGCPKRNKVAPSSSRPQEVQRLSTNEDKENVPPSKSTKTQNKALKLKASGNCVTKPKSNIYIVINPKAAVPISIRRKDEPSSTPNANDTAKPAASRKTERKPAVRQRCQNKSGASRAKQKAAITTRKRTNFNKTEADSDYYIERLLDLTREREPSFVPEIGETIYHTSELGSRPAHVPAYFTFTGNFDHTDFNHPDYQGVNYMPLSPKIAESTQENGVKVEHDSPVPRNSGFNQTVETSSNETSHSHFAVDVQNDRAPTNQEAENEDDDDDPDQEDLGKYFTTFYETVRPKADAKQC